jgi:taurine--2-oxoglutarate transaminase
VAAIKEIRRMNLVARSREMGGYLGERLRGLMARHPSIGDIRGIGLFWAVDLVKDRSTRAPFNTMADKVAGTPLLVDKVTARTMADGVYISGWISHLVIAPPLIVGKEEIDEAVRVLDGALAIADDAVTTA